MGDVWIITTRNVGLNESFKDKIEKVHPYARETGRDPDEIDTEGPIVAGEEAPENWANKVLVEGF